MRTLSSVSVRNTVVVTRAGPSGHKTGVISDSLPGPLLINHDTIVPQGPIASTLMRRGPGRESLMTSVLCPEGPALGTGVPRREVIGEIYE